MRRLARRVTILVAIPLVGACLGAPAEPSVPGSSPSAPAATTSPEPAASPVDRSAWRWLDAGSLAVPRLRTGAVRLSDGSVLVVGSENVCTPGGAWPESATDERLREFLADQCHRRSRHDEAMALIWAEFVERPSLERYQLLKAHADRVEAWPAWRTRALEAARESIVQEQGVARPVRSRWDGPADASALVRIYLWEGDAEPAWQAAVVLGCSDALWHELAVKREPQHPADALPIYQREVGYLLETKRNDGYEAAVKLLGRIRALMARLDSERDFPGYLASVRAAHGRKRNVTKLLDTARW